MIKTQFSILLHILTLLVEGEGHWLNSTSIAGSLNVNPVLVRKELSLLKQKNWIESKEGKQGGVRLAISPKKIYLSDIFLLAKGEGNILSVGKNDPNPNCPIGRNINKHLIDLYQDMDNHIIERLKNTSLLEFRNRF